MPFEDYLKKEIKNFDSEDLRVKWAMICMLSDLEEKVIALEEECLKLRTENKFREAEINQLKKLEKENTIPNTKK